jgi:hypothetical protein
MAIVTKGDREGDPITFLALYAPIYFDISYGYYST